MNKCIFIALAAIAFGAEEKCATSNELINSQFGEYKLKYKLDKDYKTNGLDDLTKGTPIGFSTNMQTGYLKTYCSIRGGIDTTTFRIEGIKAKNGFRIYSHDMHKIFSQNQYGFDKGYYMFEAEKTKRCSIYGVSFTLFAYDDNAKELMYSANENTGKFESSLGIFESVANNETQIFRRSTKKTEPAKFCFVRVTEENQTCTNDNLVTKLADLNAECKAEEFTKGKITISGQSYDVSCKSPYEGTPVSYKCEDGNWHPSSEEIECLTKDQKIEKLVQNTQFKELVAIKNRVRKAKMMKIDSFLKSSTEKEGKQYQNETDTEKEKIQNYIAESLKDKEFSEINQGDADSAIKKYYGKNSVSLVSVFSVVVCLLVLN